MSTESWFSNLCTLLYQTRIHPKWSLVLLPSKLQTARKHDLAVQPELLQGKYCWKYRWKINGQFSVASVVNNTCSFFTLSPGGLEVFYHAAQPKLQTVVAGRTKGWGSMISCTFHWGCICPAYNYCSQNSEHWANSGVQDLHVPKHCA